MTSFLFWLVFAVIVPGVVLLFAAFLLRRDYLMRQRCADLERDHIRRVYLRQQYMMDAIDQEDDAIAWANIVLNERKRS